MTLKALLCLPMFGLLACASGDGSDDDSTGTDSGTVDTSDDTEAVEDPLCAEDYSFCGDILIPEDLVGTPRSIAVVLYESIPPAGPPDAIVIDTAAGELAAGETYSVREMPIILTGEFYVWVNLYMEGGGEWAPVNGVDYLGYTEVPLTLDGSPISFEDIPLELAQDF